MFLRAVREICRPARPDVGASAKKFALRAHNGQKLAFDGAPGKFFRGSAVVGSRRASLLCRVPGSRARLLAVLTLQCAAKPYWWHGGQLAQVATSRVNVRMKGPRCPPAGPRPPPIGLACELKGVSAQDAFTETQEGLTARRCPDALYMPRETTEVGPRRIPPLVAYGGRAVGAEKSTFQQHDLSILIVGPNRLKYRLSRTRKPKSYPSSNT